MPDTKEELDAEQLALDKRKATVSLTRYRRIVELIDVLDQSPELQEIVQLLNELPTTQTVQHIRQFIPAMGTARQQASMMIPTLESVLASSATPPGGQPGIQ